MELDRDRRYLKMSHLKRRIYAVSKAKRRPIQYDFTLTSYAICCIVFCSLGPCLNDVEKWNPVESCCHLCITYFFRQVFIKNFPSLRKLFFRGKFVIIFGITVGDIFMCHPVYINDIFCINVCVHMPLLSVMMQT